MNTCTRYTVLGRAAATVAVAGALTSLAALPAAAHEELIGSTPENGAVLETAPEQIELTFSAEPMDLGSQVSVTDSTGASITAGNLDIDGTQVVQRLADAEDETYEVVWRVVSSDDHPIEGTFSYQVGDGADSPTTPVGAPTTTGAVQEATADTGEALPLWVIGATGAAIALAVLGFVTWLRRGRHG